MKLWGTVGIVVVLLGGGCGGESEADSGQEQDAGVQLDGGDDASASASSDASSDGAESEAGSGQEQNSGVQLDGGDDAGASASSDASSDGGESEADSGQEQDAGVQLDGGDSMPADGATCNPFSTYELGCNRVVGEVDGQQLSASGSCRLMSGTEATIVLGPASLSGDCDEQALELAPAVLVMFDNQILAPPVTVVVVSSAGTTSEFTNGRVARYSTVEIGEFDVETGAGTICGCWDINPQ